METGNVVVALIIFVEEDEEFLKARDKANKRTTTVIVEEKETEVNLFMLFKTQKMFNVIIVTSLDIMLLIVGVSQ